MLKNYFTDKRQLLFILLWFSLWLSIGSYPIKKNFLYEAVSLNDIYLLLRLYMPFIIFAFTVFLISLKKIKINFNNKIWITIFISVFLFQFLGLILNTDRNFEPISWVFILYSIIVCLVISNLDVENLKRINFINFFFIFVAFIIFINPVYTSFFSLNENQLFMYNFSSWNEETFGSPNVRVTGLARYCLIISIFIYAYLLTKNNKKFYFTLICLFLIFFFILNIWMLQSRLIIGALIVLFFSSLFLKNKKYTNTRLFSCFILICISVYFASLITQDIKKNLLLSKLKNEIVEENQVNKIKPKDNIKDNIKDNGIDIDTENVSVESIINENVSEENIDKIIQEKNKYLEGKKVSRFDNFTSSGRTEIWKELIFSYDKSKIFGYGVQADRHLLVDPDRNLSTNASNAILYIFVSGGYFALILFIILIFKSIILSLSVLIKSWKNIDLNFFDILAFLQINFFLLRQLLENSFGVFSVDLMLFITSFFYLVRRLEK